MTEILRRRSALRAAAIAGGAYWAGKRRMDARRRARDAAGETGTGLGGSPPADPLTRTPTLPGS
jgi:hypothetical protein